MMVGVVHAPLFVISLTFNPYPQSGFTCKNMLYGCREIQMISLPLHEIELRKRGVVLGLIYQSGATFSVLVVTIILGLVLIKETTIVRLVVSLD